MFCRRLWQTSPLVCQDQHPSASRQLCALSHLCLLFGALTLGGTTRWTLLDKDGKTNAEFDGVCEDVTDVDEHDKINSAGVELTFGLFAMSLRTDL